jgi:sulfatase maturation enzyme AslB (radical SAM superfamily)
MTKPNTTPQPAEDTSLSTLSLTLEVAGCRHACSFCWADGHYYPPMDIADVDRILAGTAAFCASEGLAFEPYPMHEVLAHPEALRIIELCRQYAESAFHPLPTPGLALAARDDREELLAGIKALGITVLWFTLHGLGDVHDRVVHARDAFSATTNAVRLGKAMGFKCGVNILVTKQNVHQLADLVGFARDIGLDEIGFEISHYTPIPRLRKYEAIRPELEDLEEHSAFLNKHSRFWKEKWLNIADFTEAHYVNEVLENPGEGKTCWSVFDPACIGLVCRSNLELHAGKSGCYGRSYGRLDDGHEFAVLRSAQNDGACPEEFIYFDRREIPDLRELAGKWGNPTGQRIYFTGMSMRHRWLDSALNH